MTKANTIRLIFLMGLLFGLSDSLNAQTISEKLCNTIFDSVNSSLKPAKIYRKNIYTSDCDFSFDINDKGDRHLTLSINKYENEEESRESFFQNSKDFYDEARPKTNFVSDSKYWDEIGLYLSKRKFDSYLLLKKKLFIVKIISDDREALLRIEKILHDIDFNQ